MSSALRLLSQTAALQVRTSAEAALRQQSALSSTRAVAASLRACAGPTARRRNASIFYSERRCLIRAFSSSAYRLDDGKYAKKAKALSQKTLDEHEQQVIVRENQVKRPWHREGADEPPVKAEGEQGESEEVEPIGKLLTTPTRLLKLVLPLPVRIEKDQDNNGIEFGRSVSPNDSVQPLALLIHPQQPLSYVERLIQAEIPPVMDKGREKIPNIYFRAEDASKDDDSADGAGGNSSLPSSSDNNEAGKHVASYSGLGHEGPQRPHKDKSWVRWSNSTEMGDFIRDAARGREFAIEIEGYGAEIRVGVPSFKDRTHYMRVRLRKMSRQVDRLAKIKHECDVLAHRGAHRLAQGGLAAMGIWWAWVYYVTFLTDYGWDLVEPVTYLAGLATIMGGYMWFLYISRELSYKAAMNITVSKRQTALYEARGFDLHRWEALTAEANALRKEIKVVADEYDIDWDETKDLGGEEVKKVLNKERRKQRKGLDDDDSDDDDDDDDSGKTEAKKVQEKKDD